jgi:hypothetical protein
MRIAGLSPSGLARLAQDEFLGNLWRDTATGAAM